MTHFASTTTKPGRCRRCRAPILTALDEGLPATVDATPLPNQAAEITALINNLWTYVHTRSGYLIHRDARRIAHNSIAGTIHAQHTCVSPTQLVIDIGETAK